MPKKLQQYIWKSPTTNPFLTCLIYFDSGAVGYLVQKSNETRFKIWKVNMLDYAYVE